MSSINMNQKVRPVSDNPEVGFIMSTIPASKLIDYGGVGLNQCLSENVVRHNTDCETVYKGQNNCYIVLGRQRSGSPVLDYGGQGHMKCAMVDIVAGLGSFAARRERNGKAVEMNPDYSVDAARVLVSEKCDVDENFKLNGPSIKHQSAIAAKADSVRIISRSGGIKLITSNDTLSSRGGQEVSVAPIQLNAGNAEEKYLQPVPRGNNLIKALESLTKKVNDLSGIVDGFLMAQIDFNVELMSHTHLDPINVALGTMAQGNPAALNQGSTFLSPEVFSAGIKNLTTLAYTTKKDLLTQELSYELFKQRYLQPYSPEYINSRHVETV